MLRFACLPLFALFGLAPAHAQDAAAGKTVFNQCRVCHQIGEGAKNGVGPHLNGLIGRPSGSVEGYAYSEANKKFAKVWDEPIFTSYIKDPRGTVPGTKMAYAGLKDEKAIMDLTAYLKGFDLSGKALK